jgi:hypothetical protein
VNDPAQCVFVNCQFWRDGTTQTTYAIGLAFTDNLTFIGTSAGAQNGSGGFGLTIFPPSNAEDFPASVAFINSAVDRAYAPLNWKPSHGIGFFPFPTGDGEVLTGAGFYGILDTGREVGIL